MNPSGSPANPLAEAPSANGVHPHPSPPAPIPHGNYRPTRHSGLVVWEDDFMPTEPPRAAHRPARPEPVGGLREAPHDPASIPIPNTADSEDGEPVTLRELLALAGDLLRLVASIAFLCLLAYGLIRFLPHAYDVGLKLMNGGR